ncbi:MAG: von Willebrand factor type A domain-containing protein [Thermoguttaceae bacterium]|jgi:Ca-activated chloride channel family protein|nr:von Willebrand factor type A domain-containing protein [Thermoguttaceae bacterium]
MSVNRHESNEAEVHAARLTAYALGQLDGPERAEVEAELAASEESLQAVATLRTVAGALVEATRHDLSSGRSPALREAIERRLDELDAAAASPPSKARTTGAPWRLLAVAACLVIAAVPVYVLVIRPGASPEGDHVALSPPAAAPAGMSEGAEAVSDLLAAAPADRDAYREAAKTPAEGPAPTAPMAAASREPAPVAAESMRSAPAKESPKMEMARPAAPPVAATSPAPTSQGKPLYRRGADRSSVPSGYPGGAPSRVAGGGMGAGMPGMAGAYQGTGMMGGSLPPAGAAPMAPGGAPAMMPPGYPGAISGTPHVAPAAVPPPAKYPAMLDGPVATKGKRGAATPGAFGMMPGAGSVPNYDDAGPVPERERRLTESYGAKDDLEAKPPAQLGQQVADEVPGAEQYRPLAENPFLEVSRAPLSTFSIDVDTASYTNIRRFLREGRLPPPEAVRIEEMINYFPYHYPPPEGKTPFSVSLEAAQCPWHEGHRLVRIGLKAKEIDRAQRGPSNLVFLLDVSGSMSDQNKLPLVKEAMKMLVAELTEDDRVAIVTYASSAELRLESTNGSRKEEIVRAIDALRAEGSTNGSAGIQLAYEQARKHFLEKGTNRIILATDGDLNVGITRDDDLARLVRQEAQGKIFLTVLGVGTGNLKDAKLEKLAQHGSGMYAYVDSVREAHKVLVRQIAGSLVTVAKDVKIQVEFNPKEVSAYRLVGYENRRMADKDFHDDRKDAGELGAGHTVTVLYEIVPAGRQAQGALPPLKYQRAAEAALTDAAHSGQLLNVQVKYKEPREDQSRQVDFPLANASKRFGEASPDFQFAAAVASFGMILRRSQFSGNATLASVEEIAVAALGDDPGGHRAEFVSLVRGARQLAGQ